MTRAEVEPLLLDFVSDETRSGFHLHRLEVFNWGTFDGQVWTLVLDGRNHLLTGDIGSGKSTLVDAVTTLLVPAHRAAYNRAAGAASRERTLRSYVLGHFKSERSDLSVSARPVSLRDRNNYTVILGVFRNEGYDQTVTLAQVFWVGDSQSQPERFFVATEGDLSIASEFARFGSDINQLRKRLRGAGVEVFRTFPPYGAWFRRRFGIENEQALDLFHQTVSMKSVGNLTEFVRGHMLEPFDVAPRIAALIEHFDDLSRAHEAVLRARRQIELPHPARRRLRGPHHPRRRGRGAPPMPRGPPAILRGAETRPPGPTHREARRRVVSAERADRAERGAPGPRTPRRRGDPSGHRRERR